MEYDGYKDICERLKRTIDARNAELVSLRDEMANWNASQHYRYIGKDGKPVMARQLEDERDALRAENERLREALEPSGDTKAAYMGEIRDPDTKRDVSWSAIKMVMRMISDRAAKDAMK